MWRMTAAPPSMQTWANRVTAPPERTVGKTRQHTKGMARNRSRDFTADKNSTMRESSNATVLRMEKSQVG